MSWCHLFQTSWRAESLAALKHRRKKRVPYEGSYEVHHLPRFALDLMVAHGNFVSERARRDCQRANALVKSITDMKDVDFGQVKVFSGVPWPSLDSAPSRVHVVDGTRILSPFIGREGFSQVEGDFLGMQRGQVQVLDYDGPMGAGKTYILTMLAVKKLHEFSLESARDETEAPEGESSARARTPKRLVCLFTLVRTYERLEADLKTALLVALWDDQEAQHRICVTSSRLLLEELLQDLKMNNDFFFVYDEWNKHDDSPNLREFLESVAKDCPCIRGGSARRRMLSGNLHRGQYELFSESELDAYLKVKGKPGADSSLRFYAGNLPLHVRLYLTALDAAKGDHDEARKFFRATNDIVALERGLQAMVNTALSFQGKERRDKLNSLARILREEGTRRDFLDGDTRWTTMKGQNVMLVSPFAKSVLMTELEEAGKDLAVVTECFASQEC